MSKNTVEHFYDSKLSLLDIELRKINAEKYLGENKPAKLVREYSYKIESMVEKEVIILLSLHLSFEPKSLFNLDAQIAARYKIKEPIEENEVNENIEQLTTPCGPLFSLISSFLSEKIIGSPVILPPNIDFENLGFKKKKVKHNRQSKQQK